MLLDRGVVDQKLAAAGGITRHCRIADHGNHLRENIDPTSTAVPRAGFTREIKHVSEPIEDDIGPRPNTVRVVNLETSSRLRISNLSETISKAGTNQTLNFCR